MQVGCICCCTSSGLHSHQLTIIVTIPMAKCIVWLSNWVVVFALQVQCAPLLAANDHCVDLTPLGKLHNMKVFTLQCNWAASSDDLVRVRFGVCGDDEQQQGTSSIGRRSSRRISQLNRQQHAQQQKQVGLLAVVCVCCFWDRLQTLQHLGSKHQALA